MVGLTHQVAGWFAHGVWIAPAISLGSALVAVQAYRNARAVARRDAFRFAADLHQDLTTGAVAAARHVVGTSLYGNSDARSRVQDQVMQSYYVLLWGFERLATGAEVLRRAKYAEAILVLHDAVEWHVIEIGKNIAKLHQDSGLRADDVEAIQRFKKCLRTLKAVGIDAQVDLGP
ncbi:hypothetical protein ACWEO2_17315 [Nocardia sp. NPDC004278]